MAIKLTDELTKTQALVKPLGSESVIEDFFKSTLYTIPELVGVTPPDDVKKFRDTNPGLGFLSSAIGYSIPYVGWFKLTKNAKWLNNLVNKVGKADTFMDKPFTIGAAREITRFAPFESLRVGSAFAFGDILKTTLDEYEGGGSGITFEGTGNVARQAALDLALGGTIVGVFEKFLHGSGRAVTQAERRGQAGLAGESLQEQFSDLNLRLERHLDNIKTQQRLDAGKDVSRNVDSALGGVKDFDVALSELEDLRRKIRIEVPFNGKYIQKLDDDFAKQSPVNKMFKVSETDSLKVSTPTIETKAFSSQSKLNELLFKAGFTKNWEGDVRFPRFLVAKNQKGRDQINTELLANLQVIDSVRHVWGTFDEGANAWVIAKRLGGSKDEYALFTTTNPDRFIPEMAKFKNEAIKTAQKYKPSEGIRELGIRGTETYDSVAQLTRALDWEFAAEDVKLGNMGKLIESFTSFIGVDKAADYRGWQQSADFFRRHLFPGMFKFSKNRKSAQVFNLARASSSIADSTARRLFFGKGGQFLEKDSMILREILSNNVDAGIKGSLKSKIQELYKHPDQVKAVWEVWRHQVSIEDGIKRFGLKEPGISYLRHQAAVDQFQMGGIAAVNKETGGELAAPTINHYGISRLWKGDHRLPIYTSDGDLIHVVGGSNFKAMQEEADLIVKLAEKEGIILKAHPVMPSGKGLGLDKYSVDMQLTKELNLKGNKNLLEILKKEVDVGFEPTRAKTVRSGVSGFIGETQPWKQEELERLVLQQLNDYQHYIAERAFDKAAGKAISEVLQNSKGSNDAKVLIESVEQVFGRKSAQDKILNEHVDDLLSSVTGKKDNATKIANGLNKFMFDTTLGFVHTSFNIANILTFVQTAYPQMAFLTKAAPASVAKYYNFVPLMGKKHAINFGVLDMFSVTRESFKRLGRPGRELRELIQRAENEGAIGAQFIEDYVGKASTKVSELGKVMRGEAGLVDWIHSVATFLPSKTERFARGHGFVLGYTFFKDVMKITDPEMLYQLSKQFLEKTQYLYGKGDRAIITAGPLGSTFGLFKNWIMHYIGWMGVYTGEAFMRGNWKPFLWMMGTTGVLAGAGGVPLIKAAEYFSEKFTDESLMEHLRNSFGETAANGMYYGLPGFLGYTMQNQVQAPFADPIHDAGWLGGFAVTRLATNVGKFFGEATDAMIARGQIPVNDPRTRDAFVRAFLPRNLYRLQQAIKDKMNNLHTGSPLVDLGWGDRIAFIAGLDPVAVNNMYKASRELFDNQRDRAQYVSAFGKRLADAWQNGDTEGANRLIQRVLNQGRFGELQSILASANKHMQKAAGDALSNKADPITELRLRQKYGL